jgi:hypothetical protein
MPTTCCTGCGPARCSWPALPPLSLYVHLPWCLRKCPYCDFNSHEWRAGEPMPERALLDALVADLDAALPLIWGRTVHSIFIGGGTPSLFSPQAIDRLLGDLRARLKLAPDCEITLEANPGTFERTASAPTARPASRACRSACRASTTSTCGAGPRARPRPGHRRGGGGRERLRHLQPRPDVRAARPDARAARGRPVAGAGAAPPHLSVYHLTIEPNTWFAKFPPTLPEDDIAYAMLDRITEMTGARACRATRCRPMRAPGTAAAQPQLLAVRRLPGHRRRRAQQAELRAPRRAAGALPRAAAVHGQRAGRHGRAQERRGARADLPFEFMLNALRLKAGLHAAAVRRAHGLAMTSRSRRGWKRPNARGSWRATCSACGRPSAGWISERSCRRCSCPTGISKDWEAGPRPSA